MLVCFRLVVSVWKSVRASYSRTGSTTAKRPLRLNAWIWKWNTVSVLAILTMKLSSRGQSGTSDDVKVQE